MLASTRHLYMHCVLPLYTHVTQTLPQCIHACCKLNVGMALELTFGCNHAYGTMSLLAMAVGLKVCGTLVTAIIMSLSTTRGFCQLKSRKDRTQHKVSMREQALKRKAVKNNKMRFPTRMLLKPSLCCHGSSRCTTMIRATAWVLDRSCTIEAATQP